MVAEKGDVLLNDNFLTRINDISNEIIDAVKNHEDVLRVRVLADNIKAIIKAERTALAIINSQKTRY
jgi:hypothetical protein